MESITRKLAGVVLLLFTVSSCANYTSVRLPHKPSVSLDHYQKSENLHVGLSFLDRSEIKRYFDADLIERGIQPIYMAIENNSEKTYHFSKQDIAIPSLDNTEASKKGARSTVARAGVPGAISLVVLWPLAIWAISDGIASSRANKALRADYESKELADGPIRPGFWKYGIVYAPILKSGEEINITLTEIDSKKRISFNFSKGGTGYSPVQKVASENSDSDSDEFFIDTHSQAEQSYVSMPSVNADEWIVKSNKSLNNGQWAEAIRTSTIAISINPELPSPYINRAWAYAEKGMFQKALADCDHALRIEPNNSLAFHNKGLTYSKMEETEKSLQNYRKACEQGFELSCSNFKDLAGYKPSEEIKTLLQWSNEKFSQGEFDKVIDLSCKIIEIEPDNYEAYSNRCAANASLNLPTEAKLDCEKAISLNPDFSMAYNNMGYVLEREGNPSEAGLYYEMSCGLGNTLGCKNQKRLNVVN